jgi:hypothetical protein
VRAGMAAPSKTATTMFMSTTLRVCVRVGMASSTLSVTRHAPDASLLLHRVQQRQAGSAASGARCSAGLGR